MGLVNIHQEIAAQYAPQLLKPLSYGENGVFFWVPGSGMTTLVRNIFTSKKLLQKHLLGFAKNTKVIILWGNLVKDKNLDSLFKDNNFSSYEHFRNLVLSYTKSGKEVALILGYIDNFPETEKISVLQGLLRLSHLAQRRVHIIFNSVDKPWFENQLSTHPEFLTLANHMEIVPVLSQPLLSKYINEVAAEFKFKTNNKTTQQIASTYGGILQLTKEYLRSHGTSSLLDTKIRGNWQFLPPLYRQEIENYLSSRRVRNYSSAYRDLNDFGIWNLKMFSLHRSILSLNSESLLLHTLTHQEQTLWKFVSTHPQQIVTKDQVIRILRSDNENDISLWAVDQAVSRFRKKLLRCGVNPHQLKTVKGKGYIWEN